MEYKKVIDLGWKDMHPGAEGQGKSFIYETKSGDYHIMGFGFGFGQDKSFDTVMINCVQEECVVNIWENSDTRFYGQIKTDKELEMVMQLIGVTEYLG
jgi:hypothetical protein